MAPVIQIFVSALLVAFGFIAPGTIMVSPEINLTPSLLTAAVAVFAAIVGASFIVSRVASWHIHRRTSYPWSN